MMKHMAVSCFAWLNLCAATASPGSVQENTAQPAQSEVSEIHQLVDVLRAVRNRNGRDYAVTSPRNIDEGKYVGLGGIEQWITIRGEDRRNPVLLFLHGGPGEATNPWSYAAFRPWLKHFTVVQWDQRGAGRTLGKNRPASALGPTITIERMTQDGIELAELIRKTLNQDKIVLVGHSWGSILAALMVKARPDLFYAFVGTGQVVDPLKSPAVAYDGLLKKAKRLGDVRAVQELQEVGPPPYPDGKGFAVQRKWSNRFEGADAFLPSTLGLALGAPGYSLRDVNDWIEGQILSSECLVPQTSALDPKRLAGDFSVPVVVIQGAEDFTTPTSLAKSFVSSIRAPRKRFIPLEGGGHFAVFMKQEAFLRELVAHVLPLTRTRRARTAHAGEWR